MITPLFNYDDFHVSESRFIMSRDKLFKISRKKCEELYNGELPEICILNTQTQNIVEFELYMTPADNSYGFVYTPSEKSKRLFQKLRPYRVIFPI